MVVGIAEKVALTFRSELTVRLRGLVDPLASPPQELKAYLLSAVALNEMLVPES